MAAMMMDQGSLTCTTCMEPFLFPEHPTCLFCSDFTRVKDSPPQLDSGLGLPTPVTPQEAAFASTMADMPLMDGYFPSDVNGNFPADVNGYFTGGSALQQQQPLILPHGDHVQDAYPDLAYALPVEQVYQNAAGEMFDVLPMAFPQEEQGQWVQQQTPGAEAAAFMPEQAAAMMPQLPQMQPAVEAPRPGSTPPPKGRAKKQKAEPRFPGQGVKKRTEAGKKNKADSNKATQLAGSMLLSFWRTNMGSQQQCKLPSGYNSNRELQRKVFALLGMKVAHGTTPTFSLMDRVTPVVTPEDVAQWKAMTPMRAAVGSFLVENQRSGAPADGSLPAGWLVSLTAEQMGDPMFLNYLGLWSRPHNQQVWETLKANLASQDARG